MVVNETVETWRKIDGFRPPLALPLVVLNQALPSDPDPRWREEVRRLVARAPDGPSAEVLRAGLWEADRGELTDVARARLAREVSARVVIVPLLDTLAGPLDRVAYVEALLAHALAGTGS
jgi:hypothetical protein